MKALIFFVVAVASVHALLMKYGSNPVFYGSRTFIDIPRSVSSANSSRWVLTDRPDGPLPTLNLYCPSEIDRVVCALYDDTEYIAGLQISLPQDAVSNSVYVWETQGFVEWSPPTASSPRPYWTTQMLFVSEEILAVSAEERIANRNRDKLLQGDSMWVTGFNKELVQISLRGAELDSNTSSFTRQACKLRKGRHYFYEMNDRTVCSAETLLPWFPLVQSGDLIGVGFMTFSMVDGNRDQRPQLPLQYRRRFGYNNHAYLLHRQTLAPQLRIPVTARSRATLLQSTSSAITCYHLILLALIALAFLRRCLFTKVMKNISKVRFDINPIGFGRTSFISLPRTVSEAKNARWVKTPRPDGPLPSLDLYCPSASDRLVCTLYDDTHYIAGLQIALPTHLYTDYIMDWETLGYTLWTPPVANGHPSSYWTLQMYYVNEATLEKSVEERLAYRNKDKTLQEANVWVTGFHKERVAISVDGNKIADSPNSLFTKQACIVLMGRHYYYNMTTLTQCDAESILPWFPLVHSGELIGVGFLSFGKLSPKSIVRDYFERPTRANVEMIIPNGPQCLYELAENPGVVTMHTYFVDAPWLINCIGQRSEKH
ncbi:hypothetical protein ACJJTC_004842 [Scirpophaga incertulas]